MDGLAEIAKAHATLKLTLAASGVTDEIGRVNWTYDAQGQRVEATDRAGVVMMGFNAGAGGRGSEASWKSKCEKLCRGIPRGFVLAELVLVSSHNIGVLRTSGFDIADLIAKCARVNQAVIAYHQPSIVIQTGFAHLDAVVTAYGLVKKGEIFRPGHLTHRLLTHYEMHDGTPWLAVRHPSSRGFSNEDAEAIRVVSLGVV